MWGFTANDLADGAQEKVVAASDFRGPKRAEDRRGTNFSCLFLLLLSIAFCGFCFVFSFYYGHADYYKLLSGMSYNGDLCEGGALYPIHRNGVGVCVDKCPRFENGDRVAGHAPEDKAKMVCMDAKDFLDYTEAGKHGFTNFATLTPINAYRYGVCNYKYRSFDVGNRCFFEDKDVAAMHPYELPTSKAVIFAQSIFSARLFIMFVCIGGAWVLVTAFLYSVQAPVVFAFDGANPVKTSGGLQTQGGEATAIRAVWGAIWVSGVAMCCIGSHLWYDAAYQNELAVNPRTDIEMTVMRVTAALLWVLGALWIWLLLRARHAVTLGVMLTMLSHRAMMDVGTGSVYWLCFAHASLCAILILAAWYAITNIASMGDGDLVTDPTTGATGLMFGYRTDTYELGASVMITMSLIWTAQFLSDVMALSTSLSVSGWFFTRDKTKYLPTLAADYETVWRCHAGTAALGSLLHPFTDGPHRFFATMDSVTAAKSTAFIAPPSASRRCEQGLAVAGAACIRMGTCGLVENCLKYTSANAYTSVAMFGTGYWASAKTSFFLIIRNVHRLGATMSVAQIIPFIGKVSVSATCAALFYGLQLVAYPDQAISIVSATFMAGLSAWVISAQFLAPMTQASSTLLQCYMLDEELFLHNENERFAEKGMHSWVAMYGGDFSAQES